MKNRIRKILLTGLLLTMMWVISGCSEGSTVDTNLVINQDLSGSRVMDVKINSSAFSSNFNGDINQLNEAVSAACPEVLTWEYANEGGIDVYHVKLDFSSPDDYKKKIEAVLGEEKKLDLAAPDTVWANGFRVKEGFTSLDLLEFMKDTLVGRGLVDKSNASSLFSNGTNNVTFNNETFSASSYIDVNQISFLPLNSIDVLTSLEDGGLYSRKIVFQIPAASMDAKGDEIKKFLEGNVTDQAVSSWEDTQYGKNMTVEIQKVSADDLTAFTRKVLASDNCVAAVSAAEKETSDFSFTSKWEETLNMESFAGNEEGTSTVRYYMQAPPSIAVEADYEKNQYLRSYDDDTYAGYRLLWEDDISSETTYLMLNKIYRAVHADVVTKAESQGQFSRSTTLDLEMLPKEEEQKAIIDRISKKAGDLASVSGKAADDGYHVTITQKGLPFELMDGSKSVFGANILSFSKQKGLWSLKHVNHFSESFDLESFIPDITEDFTITYTVDMGFLSSIKKDTVSIKGAESPAIKGGKLTATVDGTYLSAAFVGSSFNLLGLVLWLVVLAAAAGGAIMIYRTGILKKLEPPVFPKEEILWESAAAKESSEAGKIYYCTNCGHPYTEGCFCENCGEKLDD